jgi:hypothetical protein
LAVVGAKTLTLGREHERVDHITFLTKKTEKQEVGALKRLEQRLEVLKELKAAESDRSRVAVIGDSPESMF